MASRRTFLKAALGVSAMGAIGSIVSGYTRAVPYYKFVFDQRFDDACAFAAAAAERGIPTAAIRGDVTRLFFHDLDLRWKQGPVSLAGYTTRASLFCLDLLARDRGMRVRHCAAKPGVSADLVFWIIAPNARASLTA